MNTLSAINSDINTNIPPQTQSSSRVTWTIDKINENMIQNTQLQLQLHDLSILVNRVFSQQNLMRVFSQNVNTLERDTLMEYAKLTVSPSDTSIQGLLERIHLLISGSSDLKSVGNVGMLELIAANLQVIMLCGLQCLCLHSIFRNRIDLSDNEMCQ